MAYIVMTSIVMAYIAMAYIVMAYIVMAMGHTVDMLYAKGAKPGPYMDMLHRCCI